MENKIRELITKGYTDAAAVAELNEVDISDFRLWASQAIAAVFCSINEVGMDDQDLAYRANSFRQSLEGFVSITTEMYGQMLANELRDRKSLHSIE